MPGTDDFADVVRRLNLLETQYNQLVETLFAGKPHFAAAAPEVPQPPDAPSGEPSEPAPAPTEPEPAEPPAEPSAPADEHH